MCRKLNVHISKCKNVLPKQLSTDYECMGLLELVFKNCVVNIKRVVVGSISG